MPYSRSPWGFSPILHDVLTEALAEAREITIQTPEAQKMRNRFYAFVRSWEAEAKKLQSSHNYKGAANALVNFKALLCYEVSSVKNGDEKVVLIHRLEKARRNNESVSSSGRVTNPLSPSFEIEYELIRPKSPQERNPGPLEPIKIPFKQGELTERVQKLFTPLTKEQLNSMPEAVEEEKICDKCIQPISECVCE